METKPSFTFKRNENVLASKKNPAETNAEQIDAMDNF